MSDQTFEGTRRDELLMKAALLFCEQGYHATSMEDIANALGILRGSLYHHISSKQDLLNEIMLRGIEFLLEEVRPIALDAATPADRRLAGIVRAHVLSITSHPAVLTVFLHELKSLNARHLPEILTHRAEYERLVRGVIKAGIAEGVFRPADPSLATLGLLGMVNWLYQWYSPDGRCGPEEIATEFVNLALHSLRP